MPLELERLGLSELDLVLLVFGGQEELEAMGLDINKKKATPDAPDDDFDVGTVLDIAGARHAGASPWTVVAGSAAAVSLIGTVGGRYEILNPPGALAMQLANGAGVSLRMDYTLPDGASIIAALHPSRLMDQTVLNNEVAAYLALNDNDTDYNVGSYISCGFDTSTPDASQRFGERVFAWDGTTTLLDSEDILNVGLPLYLRILRDGLDYYPFYSHGGVVWVPGNKITKAGAMTNVWLVGLSAAAHGAPKTIQIFDWIRQGTNAVFPWDVVT